MEEMEDIHVERFWESVKAPNKFATSNSRGSFHINVSPDELWGAWRIIRRMTLQNRLGYMSSVSPNAMDWGRYEGDYTISVHTLDDANEKEATRAALWWFADRIYKYSLIQLPGQSRPWL